jgi:hypothetical protein
MALTSTLQNNPVGASLLKFEQAYPGKGVALTPTTIKTGTHRVIAVVIDNTQNTASSYLKLYVSAPTLGTTDPFVILKAPANAKLQYTFDPGMELAHSYGAFLTTPGITGAGAPEGTTTAYILTS